MPSDRVDALSPARDLLGMDRPQAALDALAKVPDELSDPEYWSIRAFALCELHRPAEGAEAARRGLEQHPHDLDLLDALVICEFTQENDAAGEGPLRLALELDPENPGLLGYRAGLLATRGQFDEARALMAELMRLAPDEDAFLDARASLAVHMRDPEAEHLLRAARPLGRFRRWHSLVHRVLRRREKRKYGAF